MKLGSRRGTGTLGTFAGVFTPSILTILGIILFRRLAFVVGAGGLGQALLILALANALSLLTSISLSAIATNLRVKGGGDYYIISRTLGVEYGGAIGIVLFLAQSVSIAFYCIGFGEAVAELIPGGGPPLPRLIAAGAIAFLFIFAWMGADWATRLQYVVMTALAAALLSFFVGGIRQWEFVTMTRNWSAPVYAPGFWVIFAIFFPAVTGFTQGVSMSGDLKDAGKSLPRGTLLAVGLSCLVYFGAAVVLAGGLPGRTLSENYHAMGLLASAGWLVSAGVVAATISSAMASFLGAPRILQALAADRVFPLLRPFARGAGPTNNPRRGVLLSMGIAFVTVALGNLNIVAPVVSMFFLISYGLLNYATYFEARAASPSFRPRFRWFDKRLSLLGAIGCLGAMLAINPTAGVVSAALLVAVHQYIKRHAGPARWADSSRSHLFQRVREHLFSMEKLPEHPRNWRPQILAFSRNPRRREQLLQFASWIEAGSGITTAVTITEYAEGRARLNRGKLQDELRADIKERGLDAFALAIVAPDIRTGFDMLIQSYGVGPLRANIVLLNWLEQKPESTEATSGDTSPEAVERQYGRYLRESLRLGCNIVVLDAGDDCWQALAEMPPPERRIDVWWWDDPTSRLMLLLAHLIRRNKDWERATIRLLTGAGKRRGETEAALRNRIDEIRIDAKAEVLDKVDAEAVVTYSHDAALVFVPLRLRRTQPVDPFGERPESLLSRLPVTAFVAAVEDMRLAAEPEEGKQAEIAEAVESVRRTAEDARRAEKEAEKAARALEKATARLEELGKTPAGESDADRKAELEQAAREAGLEAKRAAERAARARARAERAVEQADAVGAELPEEKDRTGTMDNQDKTLGKARRDADR